MSLGVAFQLVDDLLDFTTTGERLGKAAGADLLEGKVTLPLIYLVDAEPETRRSLLAIMRSGNYEEVSRQWLMNAVERTGALARAKERAIEYADNARAVLKCLPASKYKEALLSIPSYIIERDC
jgi:octaprenyl-diphosphate synthase